MYASVYHDKKSLEQNEVVKAFLRQTQHELSNFFLLNKKNGIQKFMEKTL